MSKFFCSLGSDVMIKDAPSAAMASATALPMPRLLPVTRAHLPFSRSPCRQFALLKG